MPLWESALRVREAFSRTNAPEQSACRAYWQSGSSMVSCRDSMASTLPLRAAKRGDCSSIRAVMSSERWTHMAETLRQREFMSVRNASSWKVRERWISSRGLFS